MAHNCVIRFNIFYKNRIIIYYFHFLFFSTSLSYNPNFFSDFKGSGKTHAFRQLEKAITKTEKMFPSTYLKPVMVNGKPMESDLSSVVTHTNHIGLRQHLASNNKILLNGDADLIAKNYGLYNVNDYTKEHERNIILCGYAG